VRFGRFLKTFYFLLDVMFRFGTNVDELNSYTYSGQAKADFAPGNHHNVSARQQERDLQHGAFG